MLQLIKDTFFISADPMANKTLPIKGLDGKNLYLDIDFKPYAYATKIGVITHAPNFIDDQFEYDNKLAPGDTVIFHQFVCQEDNKVTIGDKTYFKGNYYHLFAKIADEEIIPLEDFIFVKPIKEVDSDKFAGKFQIKFDEGNKKGHGVIFSLSKQAEKAGLKKGDTVYYTKNADYQMNVLGIDLYRMRLRNILLVVRGESLVCMNERILVKAIENTDQWATGKEKTQFGEVQDFFNLPTGLHGRDIVNYKKGISQPIEYSGGNYLLINKDSINYIK
jgi:co-chaperonin GroES (HSP10)